MYNISIDDIFLIIIKMYFSLKFINIFLINLDEK